MIGHLKGSLHSISPSLVVLDVRGVGYEVNIPLSTFYEVQKLECGDAASFFIHTHVREDVLALFGFWTDRERQLFGKLIAVSGIGPKLAQTVLSGMSSEDLAAAIARRDVRALSSVPGVGKKTAERMIVELKDKVQELAAVEEVSAPPTAVENDLVLALVKLGYRRPAAERAIARAAKEIPDAPFPELLRASLKLLSRV